MQSDSENSDDNRHRHRSIRSRDDKKNYRQFLCQNCSHKRLNLPNQLKYENLLPFKTKKEVWKAKGWISGKIRLPTINEIKELTEFGLNIRQMELDLIQMINNNFVDNHHDQDVFSNVIQALKWELDSKNVRNECLPSVNSSEVVDIAIWVSYFGSVFNNVGKRIEKLISKAGHKYKNATQVKLRKLRTFTKKLETIQSDFDYFVKGLNLSKEGQELLKLRDE